MAAEAADPSRSGADGAAGAGGVIGDWGGGARGVLPCCAPAAASLGLQGQMQGDVSSYIQPPTSNLPTPLPGCCAARLALRR